MASRPGGHQLTQHFEQHRQAPSALALPIGGTAIKRIRRLLGHHRYIDNATWWDERVDDLIRLTAAEFAAAHDVKEHTAAVARLRILGPTQRPAFWWRARGFLPAPVRRDDSRSRDDPGRCSRHSPPAAGLRHQPASNSAISAARRFFSPSNSTFFPLTVANTHRSNWPAAPS